MFKWLSYLVSADDGVSTMRLMALVSLLAGTGIALWGITKGVDLRDLATLVGVFVGSAFGGKAIQKGFEKRNGDEKTK